MPRFTVELLLPVTRYDLAILEIEAQTEAEAKQKILQMIETHDERIEDLEWDCNEDADYGLAEINSVTEIDDEDEEENQTP